MSKRIVFTGCGVLAGNAQGRNNFWQALNEGRIGYRPITLFDTEPFRVKQASEITDFDAKSYMGPKGLRNLDRSTKLLVSAAKLAIEDSGYVIDERNTDQTGVSVGTTLGSIKSISDFDEVTLKEGPRYTNPAHFPNTVINSPASQVSIWHRIKGFNTTLSTGFTASLDAMQYAYDFIQMDRAQMVFAGGVEEMCLQTFYGFYALKFLSGVQEGQPFINCPFDQRRNGIVFGEGACLLAMEEYQHACQRKAEILGEIVAFGYQFDPFRINKYNPRGTGIKAAMRAALDQAGMSGGDIDYICANANSTGAADKIEAQAIKEVFGKHSRRISVSSIKSMIGECYSVSGAMAVAAALGVLRTGLMPPTVNYRQKDPDCDLDVITETRKAEIKNVMVTNFGPSGANGCLIIRNVK